MASASSEITEWCDVWVCAEVEPGMFSNELTVGVYDTTIGDMVGFWVHRDCVRDGYVRGVCLGIDEHRVLVRFTSNDGFINAVVRRSAVCTTVPVAAS